MLFCTAKSGTTLYAPPQITLLLTTTAFGMVIQFFECMQGQHSFTTRNAGKLESAS